MPEIKINVSDRTRVRMYAFDLAKPFVVGSRK